MPATVWKGYLSFGLVSFPIRLSSAARPETVHFHMLHKKDLSRVKEVWYCAAEDRPLEKSEIVKGFEYAKNQYVVIEPDELEKVAPPTARNMEILEFVRMDDVDPIFLEKSYYVAPEEAVSRPYLLLLEAMRQTRYDALAKVAMHGREHIVILRPTDTGIVLHTMYFVDELHKEKESSVERPDEFNKKELDMAKKLVESLAGAFEPEKYHDEYKSNVEHLIEQKRNGQKVTPISQPKSAPVMDLMQALQKSLEATSRTKPAAAATKTADGKAVSPKSAPTKTARKRPSKVA